MRRWFACRSSALIPPKTKEWAWSAYRWWEEGEGEGRSGEEERKRVRGGEAWHSIALSRISSYSSSSTLRMKRHCADSSALYCTALVSNHYTTPHQARIGYSVESIHRFSSNSYPISSFCLHYFFEALLVSKSEGTCFLTPTCGVEWIGLWIDGWLVNYVYRIGE